MDKHIYFASDFHLGAPNSAKSREREDKIVRWLEWIRPTCSELFLMGDIFDFWFEYRYVVPKGFVRLFGKLAQLSDEGVQIYFFKGNHDMWVKGYFQEELGIKVLSDEMIMERSGKTFYLHHGDGLGPGDKKYKLLRKIFRNPLCQWLFGILPPAIGMGIAQAWSGHSRASQGATEQFLGADREWLAIYAKEILADKHFDYFVFGHRHLPMDLQLSDMSRYINIGEWLNYCSYAVFDGKDLKLCYFEA